MPFRSSLLLLAGLLPGLASGPGRRSPRARRGRELGGEDLLHHPRPRRVPALGQGLAGGGHRQRRGDRGQAHPHQRPRGALRQPGAGAGPPGRRQGLRHGGGDRPGHRPGRAQARRRVLLRHAPAAVPAHGPARRQGRGDGLRLPHRRQQPLDHQGDRLAHRVHLLQLPGLGAAHPDRRRHQPGQQRRPGRGRRQDDRPGLQHAGGRAEHRLHHPERGDRALPARRGRRQLRRQAGHARRAPDPGEPGAARLPQAGQGRVRHGGARAVRQAQPAQGMGRDHPHRRHAGRRPGHGPARAQPARPLPVPGAEAGPGREGGALRRPRRQAA